MKKNSLLGNTAFLILLQGVGYIIPFISFPFLTNVLQEDGYGRLNAALTIIQYIAMGTDFGFNISASKKISENRENTSAVKDIFWHTMYAKLIILLMLLLLSIAFIFAIKPLRPIIYLYIYMLPQAVGSMLFPLWYFQGLEYIKFSSFISLLGKLITLPLLVLYVRSFEDIGAAAFIISIPLLCSFFMSLPVLYTHNILKPIRLNFKEVYLAISESVPFFFGNLAIHIYILSTPLILSLFSTYGEVGYYSATDKIRSAVVGVIILLGQSIYPRVIFWFKYDKKAYVDFIRFIVIVQLPFSILLSAVFYWLMPIFVPYILGPAFYNTAPMLKIMAPMLFLIPSSFILANYLIIPHGHSIGYAIIPWIVAAVHIPISIWLCKHYGAYGGGISILITESISLLLMISYCIKHKLYKIKR